MRLKQISWAFFFLMVIGVSPVIAENVHIEEINIPQVGGNHLNEIINLNHITADADFTVEPIHVPVTEALPDIKSSLVPDARVINNAITRISETVETPSSPNVRLSAVVHRATPTTSVRGNKAPG